MFFQQCMLSCGLTHSSQFYNEVSCKASQHHSGHSVLDADIYGHEAKALVVVVLISVFLGQLSEVERVQFPAKSGNKEANAYKKKKQQQPETDFVHKTHFYYMYYNFILMDQSIMSQEALY